MKNKLQLLIILVIASALLLLANNFFGFQKMTGYTINLSENNPSMIITVAVILLIALIFINYKFISRKTKKRR